jgi:MFS family permease
MTLFMSALALQIYDVTGSVLHLAFIGLVRFIPALSIGLVAGAASDAHDARKIVVLAQILQMSSSLCLWLLLSLGVAGPGLLYSGIFVVSIGAAFEAPARQAFLHSSISQERFTEALVVNASVQSLGFVTGPVAAGLLIHWFGFEVVYVVHAALVGSAAIGLSQVRPVRSARHGAGLSARAILEGLSFVARQKVLLGAMLLDMFAVIFGGARALLPVYATDILDVGPRGYGLLSASAELGAVSMSLLLVVLPTVRRTGATLLAAVALFGVVTIAFGLSRSFALSMLLYGGVGMADQVSVILRQTTIQLETPDELRGRVSSIGQVFIGASNQLGGVESGVVAALTSPTISVVTGGLGCLLVVGLISIIIPELRRYEAPSFAQARGAAQEASQARVRQMAPNRTGADVNPPGSRGEPSE